MTPLLFLKYMTEKKQRKKIKKWSLLHILPDTVYFYCKSKLL